MQSHADNITITYDINQMDFQYYGKTLQYVKEQIAPIFDLPIDHPVRVNGVLIEAAYVLQKGDSVEFESDWTAGAPESSLRSAHPMQTTRLDLYTEIWRVPIVRLAKKYGLSNVGLAKVCKRNNIPRPPLGYWTKIAAGKKVRQSKLPNPDDEYEITIKPNPVSTAKENTQEVAIPKVKIKDRLVGLHPLAKEAKRIMEEREPKRITGFFEERWRETPSIEIKTRRRKLLILDAILRTLDELGWAVHIDPKDDLSVSLHVTYEQVDVEIAVTHQRAEKAQKRNPPWLSLRIESGWEGRSGWNDASTQTVEELIPHCLQTIPLYVRCRKQREQTHELEKVAAQLREDERQEQRKPRRDAIAEYDLETSRVSWLFSESKEWETAERVRSYAIAKLAANPNDAKIEEWTRWALEQADRRDPAITEKPGSILDTPPPREWRNSDAGIETPWEDRWLVR